MASTQDPFKEFWELLETDFPLGGPRHYLVSRLDAGLVQQLKALGILRHQRVAETYPCHGPMDIGCPRAIIEAHGGTFRAVCGNTPELCRELELDSEDVSFLSVDMVALCRAVAQALRVGGTAAQLDKLKHAYKAGTFTPVHNIKYPVYLVVHCAGRDYAEAFHALRSQATSPAFAILVPTYKHLEGEVTRDQMETLGIPVLALDGVLSLQDGQLISRVDPLSYFERLGYRRPVLAPIKAGVKAQALVCNGREAMDWLDLDEGRYQRLVADAGQYEIFADELAGTTARTSNGQRELPKYVQASYFHLLRACIEHVSGYDPEAKSLGYSAAKQLFVRARQAIDVKFRRPDGKEDWKLFKTVLVDNIERGNKTAHYKFSPERGTSFALIFQPGPPRS